VLSHEGLQELSGFDAFRDLESLFVNDNKLTSLHGLDKNARIKSLYAHNNQICTLRGSLSHFRFLRLLDLSNNSLRGLDKVVKTLASFQHLEVLNLRDNPVCEESDYRMTLVCALPACLQVLDQHVVTAQERFQVRRLLAESSRARSRF